MTGFLYNCSTPVEIGSTMSMLQSKYINMVSPRLEQFKRSGDTSRFRCPYCGDSTTDKRKTRGFIYLRQGEYFFKCHKCGMSKAFPTFLKDVDSALYYEYVREKMIHEIPKEPAAQLAAKMATPKFVTYSPLRELKKISSLAHDHPAKMYVDSRKIPTTYHYKLFYCPRFNAWTNSIIPDKLSAEYDEPRLVIPLLDVKKNLFGFQGRSFKKDAKIRYITIMVDNDQPRIYGLDDVNPMYPFYVFEGPIDSMFIPNSIATAGGEMHREVHATGFPQYRATIVYDNEPRSIHMVEKMNKAIALGYKVCLWPHDIEQKDVNDMILSGMSVDQIKKIIDDNSFTGATAKLKMAYWKKCD